MKREITRREMGGVFFWGGGEATGRRMKGGGLCVCFVVALGKLEGKIMIVLESNTKSGF